MRGKNKNPLVNNVLMYNLHSKKINKVKSIR